MLTVLMATHNGERTLPTVLEAYGRLAEPVGGWRLVVVDNASTDATPRILQGFVDRLPLTCVQAVDPGKNRALNKGLEHLLGDLVVLTDDDAVPAPDWLQRLREAADRHGEYDIFGGAIVPHWGRPPEPWLLDWVPKGVTYTITDEALQDGPIPAGQVWGPNMAVRADIFRRGEKFDETIGPRHGASYAMGSEIELTLRLEARGHRALFVRAASVAHMIRPFQMERGWVLGRAQRYGRGLFRSDRQKGLAVPAELFGVPRWLLRRICSGALAVLVNGIRGDRRASFISLWTLHRDLGYLSEARAAAGSGEVRS